MHFITGAPTNFTARRRLPRRRAPARPHRLPPRSAPGTGRRGGARGRGAEPAALPGGAAAPAALGQLRSSSGAAAPTTTPGVRREAAVTFPAARRRSERGSRPAALRGAAPALGHRRGARGGRKDGAPRCPPPAAAAPLHPYSPPAILPSPPRRCGPSPSLSLVCILEMQKPCSRKL